MIVVFIIIAIFICLVAIPTTKQIRWSTHQKLDKKILEANDFLTRMGECQYEKIKDRYSRSGAAIFASQFPYNLKTIKDKRNYLKLINRVIHDFIHMHAPDCITINMEGIDILQRECECRKSMGYPCNGCKFNLNPKRPWLLYCATELVAVLYPGLFVLYTICQYTKYVTVNTQGNRLS